MKYEFGKTFIIGLGGSIIYPEHIDTKFLKEFRKFLVPFLRYGNKFVIIVGGGRLARVFQNAAANVMPITDEDKDWIGIHSTRLNAHLLRTIFRKEADPVIFDERGKIKKLTYPITIASGWRPGWSTDFVAAAIAHDMHIREFVIAGKPAFVYDKDPNAYKGARHFEKISWKKYRTLIPKKWIPGSHAPVDPIAARLAHAAKLNAIIINGKDLKNFSHLLHGKEFNGTVIQ